MRCDVCSQTDFEYLDAEVDGRRPVCVTCRTAVTQTLRHLITETNYNTLTKGDIKEALKATGVAHPFTSDEWGPIAVAVGKEVAARVAAACKSD